MSDAIRILQERFARGEISAEDFNARLAVLKETQSASPPPAASTPAPAEGARAQRSIVESVPFLTAVLVGAAASAYLGVLFEHGVAEDDPKNWMTYVSRLHYGLLFAVLVGAIYRMYDVMPARLWPGFLAATTLGYIAARTLVESLRTTNTNEIAATAAVASVIGSLAVFVTLKRLRGAALFESARQWWTYVVVLAVIGAVTVAIGLQMAEPDRNWAWPGEKKFPLFIIHLPWQMAFAWMLARALRRDTNAQPL